MIDDSHFHAGCTTILPWHESGFESGGDLIGPGFASNYGRRKKAAYVYLTAHPGRGHRGAPSWRQVKGAGRIYIVEPTGPFEDDPNLTDKKFPGNPTKSYRYP